VSGFRLTAEDLDPHVGKPAHIRPMTAQRFDTDRSPVPPSLDILGLVTRFSADLGAMTDLRALGDRIMHALCTVSSSSHGALFVLDREHERYRRISTVGPVAATAFPVTMPIDHPVPHQLALVRRIITQTGSLRERPLTDSSSAIHSTMEAFQAALAIPHFNKGRLIAFSVLGQGQSSAKANDPNEFIQTSLAQIAANALDNIMLYEDLHRSQTLMKRTDRLKSLETIAGGFAHEIRNPLTSIKTFIQLAPERKDDADFIRDFSKVVIDDVYRIERLIQEILDYARYMEPKLTDEDLNEIVSSCLYFVEVKADRLEIKIEKELAPDLPRVMLDRQQIKQVLLNLLLNAMDAMGERGGRLYVRTHKLMKPGGKVWAQIEIEDTGYGIPESTLEHIFDPFFTTKHESGENEGTGLGLTIVHQIIQEHQGEIQVKSTVDVGTTFFVNLPALPT
jgi:signal transduction histidine kinase